MTRIRWAAGRTGRGWTGPGGGLTTKIHLVADRRCRPGTRMLSPGQHGDWPQFIPLMDQIQILWRGAGRPRTRPGQAMWDKPYSSAASRAYLRRRGSHAVIVIKEDQKNNRRARGRPGRPPAFDATRYRERNAVERCFSKLKQFRAVATGTTSGKPCTRDRGRCLGQDLAAQSGPMTCDGPMHAG